MESIFGGTILDRFSAERSGRKNVSAQDLERINNPMESGVELLFWDDVALYPTLPDSGPTGHLFGGRSFALGRSKQAETHKPKPH